jgi:hypothetical protein
LEEEKIIIIVTRGKNTWEAATVHGSLGLAWVQPMIYNAAADEGTSENIHHFDGQCRPPLEFSISPSTDLVHPR